MTLGIRYEPMQLNDVNATRENSNEELPHPLEA
jgi:hypothetical protein